MAKTVAKPPRTFQDLILTLQQYWAERGCVILQPYDMEMGAGTFHTATFLRALGPGALERRLRAALAPPDRRPLRRQPVPPAALLPVPGGHQAVAARHPRPLPRLAAGLGFDPLVHDIRFVEDNWESPTLGAWGLGWEVWLNGMEVTQFTYFQQVGGLDCRPVTGEITYGLERLAMYLQGVESVFDLVWTDGPLGPRHLWRRLSPERGRAVGVQLRARRRRRAVPPVRRAREGVPAPARGEAGAARLRAGAEGLAHLQPAGCAPRDLGHRAPALHPARAHAGARRRAGLLREPRGARLPDAAAGRGAGASARRDRAPSEGLA